MRGNLKHQSKVHVLISCNTSQLYWNASLGVPDSHTLMCEGHRLIDFEHDSLGCVAIGMQVLKCLENSFHS